MHFNLLLDVLMPCYVCIILLISLVIPRLTHSSLATSVGWVMGRRGHSQE